MHTRIAQARAARAAGDAGAALHLARRAHVADAGSAEAAFLLCVLLLEAGDRGALALLPTLERFPEYASGWAEVGAALLDRQPAAAMMALGRAAQGYAAMEAAAPTAAVAWRRGCVLQRLGRLAEACAAMERATARDAGLAEAWFALGLLRQDRDVPAAAAFAGALAARPAWHEAAFNLGVAHQDEGAMEAALDAYAVAWRLRPASLGRVAQALTSGAAGRVWLRPSTLALELGRRAGTKIAAIHAGA